MDAFPNGTNYGITAQKGGGLAWRGPSLRTYLTSILSQKSPITFQSSRVPTA